MKPKSNEEIKAFLEPIAQSLNIEIIEVTFKMAKNPILTVYADKEGGIDLDSLELLHNAIDKPLDEFDPYPAPYTLNVSSPGVDRPLKTQKDFDRKMGKLVEVKLYAPMKKGIKEFEATLTGFDGENVTLLYEKQELILPLSKIAKINEAIIFD